MSLTSGRWKVSVLERQSTKWTVGQSRRGSFGSAYDCTERRLLGVWSSKVESEAEGISRPDGRARLRPLGVGCKNRG